MDSTLVKLVGCRQYATAPATPLLQDFGDLFRAIVYLRMSEHWEELKQVLDRV